MPTFRKIFCVEIVCADIFAVLSELALVGAEMQQVEIVDCVTVHANMDGKALKLAKKVFTHLDATYEIIKQQRDILKIEYVFRRLVLTVGITVFLISAIVLPNRILFVEVLGNNNMSKQEILQHAEGIGINFFARAKDVRSEECKNMLLERMPQLQWIGITIKGCVATIQVEERSVIADDNVEPHSVSSIVSVCDGVITDQTIYRGNPLFQVGDAVKKGDMLVSGYVDCGIKQLAGRAIAEVYALTKREYRFVSPKPTAFRGEIEGVHTCNKLRIGKKVINFCNHSGIMDSTCVKMYMEDYWTFPGGFRLPVAFIKVSYMDYEIRPMQSDDLDIQWLQMFAREYLNDCLISGILLDESLQWQETDDLSVLTGVYACREMIGKEIHEGIIEEYAKNY